MVLAICISARIFSQSALKSADVAVQVCCHAVCQTSLPYGLFRMFAFICCCSCCSISIICFALFWLYSFGLTTASYCHSVSLLRCVGMYVCKHAWMDLCMYVYIYIYTFVIVTHSYEYIYVEIHLVVFKLRRMLFGCRLMILA